jgi:hypothetical protein
MRLARDLGCPDVDAMLDAMPADRLTEWIAFYMLENRQGERPMTAEQILRQARGCDG